MKSFQDGYQSVVKNIGGITGTYEAYEYTSRIETAIDTSFQKITEVLSKKNPSPETLKGWVGETWHTETFKISAIAKDRNDITAHCFGKGVLGNNGPADIMYGEKGHLQPAQVKYYKNSESTAKVISHPDYESMTKVVPTDQLNGVKDVAMHEFQRNSVTRHEQAQQYLHTAETVTDRLKVDNVESKPLSEHAAKSIAKDFNRNKLTKENLGFESENFVDWSDIARSSGQAAMHAAVMTAALAAAPHIIEIIDQSVKNGELDLNDIKHRGTLVFLSSGTSYLRGGIAAGVSASFGTGLMGKTCKKISPVAIGMASSLAINAIGYSYQYQQGVISATEMANYCMRDAYVLSLGMFGASFVQSVIPIPVLGALAGNLVGSTLGALVFEGQNKVIMGLCEESGWCFFGLVDQNYTVPLEILKRTGLRTINLCPLKLNKINIKTLTLHTIKREKLGVTQLSRGVIAFTKIGYIA